MTDGDTITLLVAGRRPVKVRLALIDAPEKRQPFGSRAKEALSSLCFDKPATVEATGLDRYGRTIGAVQCAGIAADEEMVRRGFAWVYSKYAPKKSMLYPVENEARTAGRGLWADPSPTPPWEWRKAKRTHSL